MTNETPTSAPLASPRHRIGALGVDLGLYSVTFGIGWIIWNLFTMSNGQSPGKQLLKIRVINSSNGRTANWGQMFIRQALIPLALFCLYYIPTLLNGPLLIDNIIMAFFFGIYILDFVWLFGPNHRRLFDYWANTYVVNEAQ